MDIWHQMTRWKLMPRHWRGAECGGWVVEVPWFACDLKGKIKKYYVVLLFGPGLPAESWIRQGDFSAIFQRGAADKEVSRNLQSNRPIEDLIGHRSYFVEAQLLLQLPRFQDQQQQ
jgi:hypothetical protein